MKNKKTFLASIALGIFILAMAAPALGQNGQEQGIDKRSIVLKKSK